MASPPASNDTTHRLSHRPRRDRGEAKETTRGYAASNLQNLWDSQEMTQYQIPRVAGSLATSASQIHSFAGSQESTFSSDLWASQNSAVDPNSSQQLGYPVPTVLQGHIPHNTITSSVYPQGLQDFNVQMPTTSNLGPSPYSQMNSHPSPNHLVTNHQGQYIPDLVQTQGFPISNTNYPQLSNDLRYGHIPSPRVERGTSRADRGQSDQAYNRLLLIRTYQLILHHRPSRQGVQTRATHIMNSTNTVLQVAATATMNISAIGACYQKVAKRKRTRCIHHQHFNLPVEIPEPDALKTRLVQKLPHLHRPVNRVTSVAKS
ncbi:hypothetical protein BU24DRAFT_64275 [Aaosphaeria arxii CBS 175.79]|uniref:Uncharacterized protein n=1 Tax=Aaosphaeria arxii CBS 175.79 TaxID=1450172 RepID=A0A6A5X9Z7_9PLEO|nr:uncharacterized protein BU24DRAFT_64275 [Aaosphaeria arxii CBS 175.79]KAF2009798.1 hypothetical protein BU24DRAFT_64275 [Aaosphaeria arxii CBS 175.79]